MNGKKHILLFWEQDPSDKSNTQLIQREVIVPPETMTYLTTPGIQIVQAYRFLVDDGEELIINSGLFHSLREVYGKVNPQ